MPPGSPHHFVPEARIVGVPGRGETFVRVHRSGSDAPTVLLSHGWLATADLNWFAVYGPLSARANFIAIDHRGHGRGLRTERPFDLAAVADDAAAAVRALDLGPVIACGYSMGGPISLELANRHPELVRGLVLCATALEFNASRFDRAKWLGLGALGTALRWDAGGWAFGKLIDEIAADDPVTAAWRPHLLGEAQRGTSAVHVEAGRALRRFDARPFAAGLNVPAAVVVTTADRLVQPYRQRRLAEVLGAQVIELDADHDACIRNGPAYAASIVAAIEGVAARVRSSGNGAAATVHRASDGRARRFLRGRLARRR